MYRQQQFVSSEHLIGRNRVCILYMFLLLFVNQTFLQNVKKIHIYWATDEVFRWNKNGSIIKFLYKKSSIGAIYCLFFHMSLLWSFQYGLVLLAIYISPLWGYFQTTKVLQKTQQIKDFKVVGRNEEFTRIKHPPKSHEC